MLEVNLGATAIGTGINSPQGYAQLVVARLAEISDIPVRLSTNLVEATWDTGAYVQTSGVLKRTAVKISKICNDLRLLSSGPRTGFHEINLPRMQPGSSIMPGKVNPVIPEVVNQVAFDIIGKDGGPRPSGQAAILPRAMRSSWARAWPRSVTSPFGSPPIWWKRRGIPAPMCRHPAS